MGDSVEELELVGNNFDPAKAERIREMMRRSFPVSEMHLLVGSYSLLVNFYVKYRYEEYNEQHLTRENLGEALYEDF